MALVVIVSPWYRYRFLRYFVPFRVTLWMNLLDLAKGPSSSFGEKQLLLEFVCGLVPRKDVISNWQGTSFYHSNITFLFNVDCVPMTTKPVITFSVLWFQTYCHLFMHDDFLSKMFIGQPPRHFQICLCPYCTTLFLKITVAELSSLCKSHIGKLQTSEKLLRFLLGINNAIFSVLWESTE